MPAPPKTHLVRLEDGIAAHVRIVGGPPILWLHGYTLDSSSWAPLWDRLPTWSHVGIDLPGHGASDPAPAGQGLLALAERVGGLAMSLGARHLCALSFGTMLAIEVASRFPDAFETVTLGAPALAGGPRDPAARARFRDLIRQYHQSGPGPQLAATWMAAPPDIFTHARRQPNLFAHLEGIVGRHRWSELADGRTGQLAEHVQDEATLRQIRARVLTIVGEHEMPAFVECATRILAAVPGCRQITLPGVGHLCLLEAPEAVAGVITGHLAGATPPGSAESEPEPRHREGRPR